MRKRIGIVLCGIGVLLVLASILLLKNSQSNKQYKTSTQENTEQVYEEANATTQVMADKETSTQQETQSTQQTTENRKQSAHDINPDVYEWPCGSKRFKDYEEPEEVIELAKYKKYYEQVIKQICKYSGKDIQFYADKDMLYFDECKNEGSVKVKYNKETLMTLLEKTNTHSIWADKECVVFDFDNNSSNTLIYFFENESENNSGYRMVNVAIHWWWYTPGAGA